jgi:hypothetical protein
MKREPEMTAETDTPILRRADGSVDTVLYSDRARGLRSAWLADALGSILAIRSWRRAATVAQKSS